MCLFSCGVQQNVPNETDVCERSRIQILSKPIPRHFDSSHAVNLNYYYKSDSLLNQNVVQQGIFEVELVRESKGVMLFQATKQMIDSVNNKIIPDSVVVMTDSNKEFMVSNTITIVALSKVMKNKYPSISQGSVIELECALYYQIDQTAPIIHSDRIRRIPIWIDGYEIMIATPLFSPFYCIIH